MTTAILIIALILVFMPFILWLDKYSMKNENLSKIEDWHNFRAPSSKEKK